MARRIVPRLTIMGRAEPPRTMKSRLAPDRSLTPTLSRRARERTRYANLIVTIMGRAETPQMMKCRLAPDHSLTPTFSQRARERTCSASFVVILLGLLLVSLAGCRNESPIYTVPFQAFGDSADLRLLGVERDVAEVVSGEIRRQLELMQEAWYSPRSLPLARLNAGLASGEPFVAPPSLLPLLLLSQQLADRSGGLFNPAQGSLVKLWGFDGDKSTCGPPPKPQQITRLLDAAPCMADIRIDGLEVVCANPAVRINLAGIAKGYAIDVAIEALREQGVRDAMLRIGDDQRAIGDRAGKPWRIAVRRPSGSAVYGIIEIGGDESVFTVGDYECNFLHEGRTFHYLIDPRTGYPGDRSRAVTVVHREAAIADAAARALFVAGPERWRVVAASMGVDHVLLFDKAGAVHMSPAMAKRIERLDEDEVIISPPILAAEATDGPG